MATIYDVARLAGVSPKTVSRVLNGDAPVNEKTREAVNKAMADLAYVPSRAARSMRSRHTRLVGMVTGAISMTPGHEASGLPDIYIVQGAQRVFAERGMTVLIADTGGNVERVEALTRTFLEHRVEGLLHIAEFHQRIEIPPNLRRVPTVLTNCFDDAGTPAVVPDDEAGQRELVRGLVAHGHRRIGFLTLPERMVARTQRIAGYEAALAEAGIPHDPALVVTAAFRDKAHEYDLLWDALDRLLALKDPPTALCCGNDKMAMRVYALLRERGLSIPADISVAGYDDYRTITEQLDPPLSSVKLAYDVLGARAAARLMRLIAGQSLPDEPAIERVSGPITWRASVATLDPVITSFRKRRTDA